MAKRKSTDSKCPICETSQNLTTWQYCSKCWQSLSDNPSVYTIEDCEKALQSGKDIEVCTFVYRKPIIFIIVIGDIAKPIVCTGSQWVGFLNKCGFDSDKTYLSEQVIDKQEQSNHYKPLCGAYSDVELRKLTMLGKYKSNNGTGANNGNTSDNRIAI